MYNTKLSLTVTLPGSVMVSKLESLKQLKKPVLNQYGKPVYRNGKPAYKVETVDDYDKCDRNFIKIWDKDHKKSETLEYCTRKSVPARQVINMGEEAYNYMISDSYPEGFIPPHDFIPNKSLVKKGFGRIQQAWMLLSPEARLLWHCNNIAQELGGTVESYKVFDD